MFLQYTRGTWELSFPELKLEYLGIWRRKVGLDFTGVLSSFGDVPLSSTELSAFLNISGPRRKRRKLISSSEWPESEETGKNLTEGIGPAVTLTSRESSLCLGTSGHVTRRRGPRTQPYQSIQGERPPPPPPRHIIHFPRDVPLSYLHLMWLWQDSQSGNFTLN